MPCGALILVAKEPVSAAGAELLERSKNVVPLHGGPRVRILLPPAGSQVANRTSSASGDVSKKCCPLRRTPVDQTRALPPFGVALHPVPQKPRLLPHRTRGAAVPETGAAWAKALEMAEGLGDAEFQLRSPWGLWTFHLNSGRQRLAHELAQKFSIIAASSSEPFDRLLGERMLGVSEHHLGSLPSARLHLERVLAAYVTSDHRHIIRFQIDLRGARSVPAGDAGDGMSQ
jgi:hypothetical protein